MNNNWAQPFTVDGPCNNAGDRNFAWQQWIPSRVVWLSNIQFVTYQHVSVQAMSNWTRPLDATYFGEVHTVYQTTMPGSGASPTDWSSMAIQEAADRGGWIDACGTIFLHAQNDYSPQRTGNWGLAAPNCDHIQAWTGD